MAQQQNIKDFATKFSQGGGPKGLGLGLKLLGAAGFAAWAAVNSVYTGMLHCLS